MATIRTYVSETRAATRTLFRDWAATHQYRIFVFDCTKAFFDLNDKYLVLINTKQMGI